MEKFTKEGQSQNTSAKTNIPNNPLFLFSLTPFIYIKKALVHGSLNCRVLFSPCVVIRTPGVNYRKLTKLNCLRSRKIFVTCLCGCNRRSQYMKNILNFLWFSVRIFVEIMICL